MDALIAYVVFCAWCLIAHASDRQFEREFRAAWRVEVGRDK